MICECRDLDRSDIWQAIELGARTIDDVRQATGACRDCGSCAPKVQTLLSTAEATIW